MEFFIRFNLCVWWECNIFCLHETSCSTDFPRQNRWENGRKNLAVYDIRHRKFFSLHMSFSFENIFRFWLELGNSPSFVAFRKYLPFVRVLSLATTSELTNKGDKSTELFFFSLNKTLIFHYEIHNKSQKKAFRAWDKKCGKEEIIFK